MKFTFIFNILFLVSIVAIAQPKFKFTEETHDFGTITQGSVVEYEFEFTNVGNEPLVLQDCSASCGCTTPTWSRNAIKPGGTGKILVKFNSQGKMGSVLKQVFIVSNVPLKDPTKQKYEIYIKANIVAPSGTPTTAPGQATPIKN